MHKYTVRNDFAQEWYILFLNKDYECYKIERIYCDPNDLKIKKFIRKIEPVIDYKTLIKTGNDFEQIPKVEKEIYIKLIKEYEAKNG